MLTIDSRVKALKKNERVVDTNLVGTFRTVKHVSKYMIEKNIQGKMTLVSSNCAWLSYPVFGGYPHYASSKGGVISLTIEAAKELKRFGIKVNTVAPGGMATIKSVDGVARVVYAMCTELTDCITGECIVPDNGMSHNILKYQPEISQYPED